MADDIEVVEEGGGGDSQSTAGETVLDATPYDWHNDIHPDVKTDEVWKSVPDLKTLTKSYADAVKYNVGAIKMPAKDATPEQINDFYRKLGRPESAEGYQLPESLKSSPRAIAMRGVAHSAGLTPDQWRLVAEGYERIGSEDAAQQAALRDQTITNLQGKWGAAFDTKVSLVQRLIRTFGGDETFENISKNPIGNDAGFLEMMATVAEAMAEEELISRNVEGVASKEDAQRELDTLTNSQVYLNPRLPGHANAVKRATQLFEVVYN